MKKWILPVIVVGLVGFYFINKKRLADKIKVLFRKVKLGGSITRPQFLMKFGIQNPTGVQANINSLVGQVEANGKIIADVSSFKQQIIAPKQESIYEITAEPYGVGIFKTIKEFLKSGKKIDIVFTGTINVDNIDYPVKTNIAL